MALPISDTLRPILCVVLDASMLGPDPRRFAQELYDAGVDWIQLRDRELESNALYTVACHLVAARNASTRRVEASTSRVLIVNQRCDIALAAGADGVHLGFDAIAPEAARKLLGDNRIIGRSLHSPLEVAQAAQQPGHVSYAHLAPIWNPISKPATRPALGADALESARIHGLPLFAQGGIDPDHAVEAIEAGACGVAVTGLITKATRPAVAVSQLRHRLDSSSPPAGTKRRNHRTSGGDSERMP